MKLSHTYSMLPVTLVVALVTTAKSPIKLATCKGQSDLTREVQIRERKVMPWQEDKSQKVIIFFLIGKD